LAIIEIGGAHFATQFDLPFVVVLLLH